MLLRLLMDMNPVSLVVMYVEIHKPYLLPVPVPVENLGEQ